MSTVRLTFVSMLLTVICVAPVLGRPSQTELQKQARITKKAAARIGLAGVNHGQIKSAELEKEDGLLIWSFDIATPGTRDITEVWVDAKTGKIASLHREGPGEQALEKAVDGANK